MDAAERVPRPSPIDPGRVRAVVFDLFGTLVPGTPIARRSADAAATARILGVDPKAFHDLLHATFTERATGALGDGESALRILAARLGASPDAAALAAAAQLRHRQLVSDLVPRPDAVATLAALSGAGYPIGLVSDCGPEVPLIWPTLTIAPYFGATVFSSEAGRRKPDPSLYRAVCRRLQVEPAACLYVGDGDSHELTGAARVGMSAVRLAAEDAEAPALVHYDHDTQWRGPTVPRLADVPRMLGLPAGAPGERTAPSPSAADASSSPGMAAAMGQ